ncbi:putative integral membrane protein [Theileria parva strain Muguga]|uniref:putative integral membrane protein n=1 Tax=Theileria parva strain Muguga TaxID=333668 RepID=UPI001C61AFDA|nr:putative integral membrane protein [Theileria parva strain Muguga]KAF5153556.1 putative integral membrane protein [Theileria parva strain Muguga]
MERRNILEILKRILKNFTYLFTKTCYDECAKDMIQRDFIGPFFITLAFSLAVYNPWKDREGGSVIYSFALFFLILWIGPVICGINATFMGSNQDCLCVISAMMYFLFPVCLATVVALWFPILYRMLIILPSFGYSNLILYRFLKAQSQENRQILVFQPVLLFYSIYTILAILN